MIKIKSLNKFFNKGHSNEIHVINDVSLDLQEKGMVAIFGKSGCGKTTLLNVIGGLDRFEKGEISVDGKNIKENTDDLRNKYIGYIFQNYNLNKLESCYENVADALRLCGITDKNEIDERVKAALKNVSMDKYAKRTPDTLSGGQQQRIAIARAIVKNPAIILADEPTGNLDESNTVMIMDLLKAISKDHLVLLVTHEANLVDYYCDEVVEIKHGKIDNIRYNTEASGYRARDKNDIYLGELDKKELSDGNTKVEYYGDELKTPFKLKIVNTNGKIYVKIDTENAFVLDETSEIKLVDGVFHSKNDANKVSKDIDMSKLPPIEPKGKLGRLFSFKSCVKSGYNVNFAKKRKGKRFLRVIMMMFATIIVFTAAFNGKAIKSLLDIDDSYNHNTFYVNIKNQETADKLRQAAGNKDSGIDFSVMKYDNLLADSYVYFSNAEFETFNRRYSNEMFSNAIFLNAEMCKDSELLCGKKSELYGNEIVVTSSFADKLIENSSYSYIKDYNDIVGITSSAYMGQYNNSLMIAGVVKGDENIIYMTEMALAQNVNRNNYIIEKYAKPSSEYLENVKKGEVTFAFKAGLENNLRCKINDIINISGYELKVADILEIPDTYQNYLDINNIEKITIDEYFYNIVAEKDYGLTVTPEELQEKAKELKNKNYFEYYDYYYSDVDSFAKQKNKFAKSIETYIYVEKGIDEMGFSFTLDEDYYKANKYKQINGRYPSFDEFFESGPDLPSLYSDMNNIINNYVDEFSYQQTDAFYPYAFICSDEDYIEMSKYIDSSAGFESPYESEEIKFEYLHNILHSNDVKKTENWLASLGITDFTGPDEIGKEKIYYEMDSIILGFVTTVSVLVIMSICMYFIMRSALMSRIKEVGIYRAIGVTKKNLIYKFFVESAVLTTLSVLLGYILTSLFIRVCYSLSPLMYKIFYYPHWLSLAVLLIIYGICLLFGTIPVISLLKKTPSEILSKYDI